MKKITALFQLCTLFWVSLFGKESDFSNYYSMNNIGNLTPDQAAQALAALNVGGKSSFSNYSGFEFEMYTGLNPSLDFNGDATATLFDTGEAAEPFVLTVANSSSSARSFYLSQGLLYTRGAETAGQLRTGTFAAIEDTGTATSLTASTDNSITIEQFIAYCNEWPCYVPYMQATTNQATNQLAVAWQYYKQGLIKNEVPTVIPLRKYANGDQYNLQFQDFAEPLFISAQDIIIVKVAGSSTLTLNIYPLAAKSARKELSTEIKQARAMVKANAVGIQQADSAFKTAIASRMV